MSFNVLWSNEPPTSSTDAPAVPLVLSVIAPIFDRCVTGVALKNPSFCDVAVPIFVPVVVFRIISFASAIVSDSFSVTASLNINPADDPTAFSVTAPADETVVEK